MSFRAEIDSITPGLRRFARALVLDEHDARSDVADSLVHQTILRAISNERTIEAGALRRWLYAALIDANRIRRMDPSVDRQPPQAPVAAALGVLNLDDRAALLLVALEGFTYAGAAEILRIPRATLVQRLVRARVRVGEIPDAARAADPKRQHPHLRLVK